MGFSEIENRNTMTVVRWQDGQVLKGKMKICDAEGKFRSPFDGAWVTDDLWFCAKCYEAYRGKLSQDGVRP